MGVAAGPNTVEDGLVLALDAGNVKSNSEISFNKWNNVLADSTTVSSVGVITCLSVDNSTNRFFGIDYVADCTQGGSTTFDNRPPSVANMNTILDNMANCKEYQTGTYNSTGALFGAYGDAGNVCTLRFTGFGVGAVIGIGGYFTHTTRQCRLKGDLVNSPVTITSPSGGFVDPIVLTSDPADIQFSNPGAYGDPWYIYWIGSYNQVPYVVRDNPGYVVNGATYSSDDGGALVFDGTDDCVDVTNNANLYPGTGDFTAEVWCLGESATSDYHYVLSNYGNSGSNYYGWYLLTQSNGSGIRAAMQSGSGTTAVVISNTTVNLNDSNWHHVVFVRSGNATRLYHNGEQLESDGDVTGYNVTSSEAKFRIGKVRDAADPNGGYYFWNGKISVVKIYKGKGLTAQEIQQNYNALKGRYV